MPITRKPKPLSARARAVLLAVCERELAGEPATDLARPLDAAGGSWQRLRDTLMHLELRGLITWDGSHVRPRSWAFRALGIRQH